jgi:hypothetical protein
MFGGSSGACWSLKIASVARLAKDLIILGKGYALRW